MTLGLVPIGVTMTTMAIWTYSVAGSDPNGTVESVLYRNDGAGVFTRVIFGSVVTWRRYLSMLASGATTITTAGSICSPGRFGRQLFPFHNNGDGTFTRATEGTSVQ